MFLIIKDLNNEESEITLLPLPEITLYYIKINLYIILKKRGKQNKQIRYFHYCLWARSLYRKEIGPSEAHYGYPKSVLDFIRELAPGDIVGEIRDDAYKISMKEFCESLDIPIKQ